MKLLILTQKVDKNDDILGFFHGWLLEFAKHVDQLTVICLQKGEYDLPENVKVLSLGKEKNVAFIEYITRFYRYIFSERKNYDTVFVHMNPEYVVLGGWLWRLMDKKIALWYTHKSVDIKLRIAEKIVHKIFTVSKESFRLKSKKVNIMGHGINLDKFQTTNPKPKTDTKFQIVTVGRISKTKNTGFLLEVADVLRKKNFDFYIKIAGAPITKKDELYFEKLRHFVSKRKLGDNVEFTGSIPYEHIDKFYQFADLFINLSDTGSIDKVVLEAMASGIHVITSNEAFVPVLHGELMVEKDPKQISERIIKLSEQEPSKSLKGYVEKNHNLCGLISKVLNNI
ncbi:glycosyltransferase family 4 protein [Patescibacteria group bacterium]